VERLPAVVEYAAMAGAVIGSQLAASVDRAQARHEIESILEQQAHWTVFEPIIDLGSDDVVGFEALTRFSDGTPPDRRFREAEAAGLGAALQLACLRLALRSAARLPNECWVSLNVSPALIVDGDALHDVVLGSRRPLVLEVTEHSPVDDYGALGRAVDRLGSGVRLAVDDAGAGFASFRHILELRPHFVKLDHGLVRGIAADPARQALIAGMVHFAARTGAILIGEGVETTAERRALAELGVSHGQGYLFGRFASAEDWLARWPWPRQPGSGRQTTSRVSAMSRVER
jgi:EAL domain-containing protein (putative c-di-GMP-specific phosphodiesterase class I)